MPVFEITGSKAKKVDTQEFENEIELHKLIDKNLSEIFNIRYIKDEHVTAKHGRIETLAIDESNRPVVIEYKKNKEKGQLVQANRYMTWIKQNPDSFELLVRKNIKNFKGKIDFANPRIIGFAQEFTIDDKCLALSLDAELWKYRFYENNMLVITREEEPEQLIQIKGGKQTIERVKKQSREARTVEQHLTSSPPELVDMFNRLDEEIMNLGGDVERYTTNAEIVYKTSLNFLYVAVQNQNKSLRILMRTTNDKLADPLNLTTKIPKTHGYGNITRQLHVKPDDEAKGRWQMSDILELITQSYDATQ
ncbi:MAG TPA: DUF5655 domain-containing protein [Prolixibacteraceae bacterium]|nr:DUF5655 domain-containing protein [Prolixibacteraceae bacterium]